MIRAHLPAELGSIPLCDSPMSICRRRVGPLGNSRPRPDTTAFLQYSSGTTGLRKGVAISHRALLRQVGDYSAPSTWLAMNDRQLASVVSRYGIDLRILFAAADARSDRVNVGVRLGSESRNVSEAVTRPPGHAMLASEFRVFIHGPGIGDPDLAGIDLSSLRGVVNCSEPFGREPSSLFESVFGLWVTGGGPGGFLRHGGDTFAVTPADADGR